MRHNHKKLLRFNLVIENLLISTIRWTNQRKAWNVEFQSRNRESSNFNTAVCKSSESVCALFQSRNRESSNFNENVVFVDTDLFLGFNLVIENLLISTQPVQNPHLGIDLRFQSRNRESSNFNRAMVPVKKHVTPRFNLVIENLLISTGDLIVPYLAAGKFQSRNRESSNFNSAQPPYTCSLPTVSIS